MTQLENIMNESAPAEIDDDFELEEDEQRIAHILIPGEKIEELPNVTMKLLEKYYKYLYQNLPKHLLLTGQESFGYFSWEEKFEWGYGSNTEHDQLKKKRASYNDKFKLINLKNIDSVFGIIVEVLRITDNKKFDIPLADLESDDENSNEHILLEDYSMWFVNYN